MSSENKAAEIITGIVFLFLCHGGLVALSLLMNWLRLPLTGVAAAAVFAISLTQLLYAIPLYLRYKRRRRFNAMKGVVIGMILTVLLNGGCFGLLLWALSTAY